MELLSKYVDCVLCKRLLKLPVLLPCKHSICKSHENEAAEKMDGTRMIECAYCEKSFEIPIDGFPQTISTIYVDANQDNLIKDLKSMFSDMSQQINRAQDDHIEIIRNLEGRVYRVINEIRKKIDNIAELSASNIDRYTKMVEKIDYFETACIERCSLIRPEIEYLKEVTDKIISFESDVRQLLNPPITHETMLKWREISDKVIFHLKEIQTEFDRYNEELFIFQLNGFNFKDLSDNSFRNLKTLEHLFTLL